MSRHLICVASLLLASACAQAGEAGRIVFVTGKASIANHLLSQGDAVNEGDEIQTGADGYVYLKTVDNGFLILRPASRARVVSYHVDHAQPQNTRIKLELLQGVARSISGEAVKQARQNFRFNTPVAAIGVRGTDFTVFTDAETSRVAVISGGIVVSGFSGSCGPEGSGPCEGLASRELFANQVGQMLQVRRGQAAPQVLPLANGAVETLPAVKVDETVGKPSALLNAGVSLDPQKDANLQKQQIRPSPSPAPVVTPPLVEVRPEPELPVTPDQALMTVPQPIVVVIPDPPPITVPPPVPVPVPVVPSREISWGRWQVVVNPDISHLAKVDLASLAANSDRIGVNNFFGLYVSKQGASWQVPERGEFGFKLQHGEAVVQHETGKRPAELAQLENGKLLVNFDKKIFDTSLDLLTNGERLKLEAQGSFSKDGKMFGGSRFFAGQMDVTGVIGAEAASAYYLFQGRLDSTRVVYGATQWGK